MANQLAQLNAQPSDPILPSSSIFFDYFETKFDPEFGILWVLMRSDCPRKFTQGLLNALKVGQNGLAERLESQLEDEYSEPVHYQVLGSNIPGVFSLGGDILLFRELIAARDRASLLDYAVECIDVVYTNAVNYRLPITTISLVQGDALGGGFEAALAANVVIAERGCKMGLPEILFNLFPGMGAYQLLTQRMTPRKAESLITSGRTVDAEDLHELGVVDVLAEPGEGQSCVLDYIKSTHPQRLGRQALRFAMLETAMLDYDQLIKVANVWVDSALNLGAKDVEVLTYLIEAQNRQRSAAA